MASMKDFSSVQVLYQLSWDHGKLEHPHMIEVQYPSNQGGLRLKDVKKRLTTLRGHGIGQSFSWSYKRNYRNTFIWNDLCDDDVIHPLRGSGEYLLKASELMDPFASKPAEPVSKYQIEKKKDFRTTSSENAVMKDAPHSGADSLSSLENESKKLPTLSVDQDTIDVEKSDFCLSSSDNEISPRPKMADINTKPVKDQALVAITRSPTVQGLQTPPHSSLPSPTELPFSPGRTTRMWKREIRKSLFRTTSRNVTATESPVSAAESEATLHAETPAPIANCRGHENALLWRHGRSKSMSPSTPHELKEEEKEETESHSTSQVIRSLWARWTGGSGKGKRSTPPQSKQQPRSRTKSPGKEKSRRSPHVEQSHQLITVESKSINDSVSLQEDSPVTQSPIIPEPAASVAAITDPKPSEPKLDEDIAAVKTAVNSQAPEPQFPQPGELKKEKVVLSVEIPNLEVDVPDSPSSDTQGGPPEAEIDTPKPAIARVKTGYGLPRVRTTTSPKPLPPGFHKGTNDTKPVQTPRRNNLRNYSTPLTSPPPLMRSLSRDAIRSLGDRGASITPAASPESKDSVTWTPSPESPPVKKCINFRERDERPLQPGLTNLDWEKALQEAVSNCLPPPNFGDILQRCSTCGRTFKPDSLQVHKRGCHPPQYSRAFSARASPMVRSRAA
ncbi:hypothetical protein KC19_2G111400 [Ceratodon purpureus]|uniref:C2HC/C3H-type domain-containing protein n=1 Tax=Ceratodon purpureus TaxID=3225 RepID=A0A8T0IWI4_CERPU|nr:hypothetical protein KC19_2G111400 [Ceratodon purpureus]